MANSESANERIYECLVPTDTFTSRNCPAGTYAGRSASSIAYAGLPSRACGTVSCHTNTVPSPRNSSVQRPGRGSRTAQISGKDSTFLGYRQFVVLLAQKDDVSSQDLFSATADLLQESPGLPDRRLDGLPTVVERGQLLT